MVVTQELAVAAWWARTYAQICHDLGFDPDQDHKAALLLSDLLQDRPAAQLNEHTLRLDTPVVVAGAADSLDTDLRANPPREGEVLVAADGAVTGLFDAGLTPDVVVSDLDGDLPRLVQLSKDRVPIAVHAHGDNIERLKEWVPQLAGPVMGTRQTPGPAPSDIVTPGGLGDGDRAVFLAARLGSPRIRLVGFDLHGEVGRLSRSTNPALKKRKMEWSARILSDAHRLGLPLEEREGKGIAAPGTS